MVAVYSQPIFHSYPAALWLSLAGPFFEVLAKFWLNMTIVEAAWALPLPICSRHEPHIMEASVYEVSNLVMILTHIHHRALQRIFSSSTYTPYMHI